MKSLCRLGANIRSSAREVVRAKATFYDTFEWGIWFGQRLLYQSGGQLCLCERDHDWIGDLRRATPIAARRVPRFVWEFPEGDLRRRVGAARRYSRSDARCAALDPGAARGTAQSRREDGFPVRSDLLCFEGGAAEPFYRLCHFRPLRGYEAEAAKAIEILRALGAKRLVKARWQFS